MHTQNEEDSKMFKDSNQLTRKQSFDSISPFHYERYTIKTRQDSHKFRLNTVSS